MKVFVRQYSKNYFKSPQLNLTSVIQEAVYL